MVANEGGSVTQVVEGQGARPWFSLDLRVVDREFAYAENLRVILAMTVTSGLVPQFPSKWCQVY